MLSCWLSTVFKDSFSQVSRVLQAVHLSSPAPANTEFGIVDLSVPCRSQGEMRTAIGSDGNHLCQEFFLCVGVVGLMGGWNENKIIFMKEGT